MLFDLPDRGRTVTEDSSAGRRLADPVRAVRSSAKVRGAGRGRPWEAQTIAAAIDLLIDGETTRLTPVARGRLSHRLSGMTADQLVRATGKRAKCGRYRASAPFLDQVKGAVTLTGSAAVGRDLALARLFGLAGSDRDIVDGEDAKRAGVAFRADSWQAGTERSG